MSIGGENPVSSLFAERSANQLVGGQQLQVKRNQVMTQPVVLLDMPLSIGCKAFQEPVGQKSCR